MPMKRDLGAMAEVTIQGVGCLHDTGSTVYHRVSYADPGAVTTTTAAPTTTTTAP
jgi:hypothetical protein